jgi:hypothetical protein
VYCRQHYGSTSTADNTIAVSYVLLMKKDPGVSHKQAGIGHVMALLKRVQSLQDSPPACPVSNPLPNPFHLHVLLSPQTDRS